MFPSKPKGKTKSTFLHLHFQSLLDSCCIQAPVIQILSCTQFSSRLRETLIKVHHVASNAGAGRCWGCWVIPGFGCRRKGTSRACWTHAGCWLTCGSSHTSHPTLQYSRVVTQLLLLWPLTEITLARSLPLAWYIVTLTILWHTDFERVIVLLWF